MNALMARSLSWEWVPISLFHPRPASPEAGAAPKTWMGLPVPGGHEDVGLMFAATCLGHHARGPELGSAGPMTRIHSRVSGTSGPIARDYGLLHLFCRHQLLG